VFGWGVWGHNHINKGAVLALPKEMGMFFYNHVDYLVIESTGPDQRKYTYGDKSEFCRHYIDLENYHYTTRDNMPRTLADAQTKYGKDMLDKSGILPWYIQEMMKKLTAALKNKRKAEILLLAADLGHYIGDAHMPLHTTENHDGQLTGQQGIHAFWESHLPELFGKTYNLYTGEAHYIKDVERATWDIIDSSYSLVGMLLTTEARMKRDNPEDKQYVIGADGKPKKNSFGTVVHTYEYAHVYHELLNGMVERQMRKAIKLTADFWYTAWVNAGKPDLSDLDLDYVTERNKQPYKDDIKAWMKGKVRGCRADKDFE
jgi:S1/P1 Nuclease